jgi:hypothetical protein
VWRTPLGIGAQESVTPGFQRSLRPCQPEKKPAKGTNVPAADRFFPSVGINFGIVDQRLYFTSAKVYSAILPLSTQATYVFGGDGDKSPPRAILSGQVQYTPLLNALHAYQLYENATLLFPTAWKAVTISISQSDYYVNNAPRPDKRNYQSETIQLNFSFSTAPPQTPKPSGPGACYTADKSTHLYCYNTSNLNACPAPSIFRDGGHCAQGVVAIQ